MKTRRGKKKLITDRYSIKTRRGKEKLITDHLENLENWAEIRLKFRISLISMSQDILGQMLDIIFSWSKFNMFWPNLNGSCNQHLINEMRWVNAVVLNCYCPGLICQGLA